MFKSLMIYRLGTESLPELHDLQDALQAAKFVECGASQDQSMGWVPPRGNAHDDFAESVAGARIVRRDRLTIR